MQNALMNGQAPYNPTPVATAPGGPAAAPSQQQLANGDPASTIGMATNFMRNGFEDTKDPLGSNKSPLADLAKNTGGAYIDAQGSLKKPLEQMLEDMTTYYEMCIRDRCGPLRYRRG